jgi:hypothetical protein
MMNMKIWVPIFIVVVVGLWWYWANQQGTNNVVTRPDISIDQPAWREKITSPLTISGRAVGNWYFEASFPIKLMDSNNQVLATTIAQAQGDWMTTDLVDFTASLTFPTQPAGSQGTLVFEKDNPSGLPANADSYSVNVKF